MLSNMIRVNRFRNWNSLKSHFSVKKEVKTDGESGEDYLKVHEPNLFWFPKADPTDTREIGPYPKTDDLPSNDLSKSAQFRPADLDEYFDRQQRRKFGEVVPEEAEIQSMWNVDIEGNYSVAYMLSGVGLLLGGLGGIAYLSTKLHDPEKSPRFRATEKELPFTEKYFPSTSKPSPIFTKQ